MPAGYNVLDSANGFQRKPLSRSCEPVYVWGLLRVNTRILYPLGKSRWQIVDKLFNGNVVKMRAPSRTTTKEYFHMVKFAKNLSSVLTVELLYSTHGGARHVFDPKHGTICRNFVAGEPKSVLLKRGALTWRCYVIWCLVAGQWWNEPSSNNRPEHRANYQLGVMYYNMGGCRHDKRVLKGRQCVWTV